MTAYFIILLTLSISAFHGFSSDRGNPDVEDQT